jgi:hypothetical protein
MTTDIEINNNKNDHTSEFIDDTKDVLRRIRIWGVNNKIFTLEGFDTTITNLDLDEYTYKTSRLNKVNSQNFCEKMKQLLRTCCRAYCINKNLDITTFKIEEFKKLMQAAAVLPIKIMIDWLLDETKRIYFIKSTESFTTICKNGFMLEDFELDSLDEANDNGTDVDYEIDDIVDYRINKKTSKEQFNVKWTTINGKKFKNTWTNASLVDAPILSKKIKRLRANVVLSRPYANNRYILSNRLYKK